MEKNGDYLYEVLSRTTNNAWTWGKIFKLQQNHKSGFTVIYVIFIKTSYDLGLKVNWDKAYNSVPIENEVTF
jgi:hypothetical protein